MGSNISFIHLMLQASLIVKLVMLILITASIASWSIIIHKVQTINAYKKKMRAFENEFYAGTPMENIFARMRHSNGRQSGMANIFTQAMSEYTNFSAANKLSGNAIEQYQRVMSLAINREIESLQKSTPLLATIGSTSPYVGLFGTVWGIMISMQSLTNAGQATISMVAPGISEALVATAMGLFAAIPAVIGYNYFTNQLNDLAQYLENFADEMLAIFTRNTYNNNPNSNSAYEPNTTAAEASHA
jgi:biopolymer transport protein TolQ